MIALANDIKIRPRPSEVQAGDITKQITRALPRHASIEASNIHVTVENGNVTLEGTILTYAERELVEEAVSTTAGVEEFDNHLRVG